MKGCRSCEFRRIRRCRLWRALRSAAGTSGPTDAKMIAASSLFRRHFVGTAGPNRAKFFRSLLCCFVARASEREEFAPFVNRNLRDQMRRVAEPVNAKTPRIARFAIRSVTDQSRAKQRRNLDVV